MWGTSTPKPKLSMVNPSGEHWLGWAVLSSNSVTTFCRTDQIPQAPVCTNLVSAGHHFTPLPPCCGVQRWQGRGRSCGDGDMHFLPPRSGLPPKGGRRVRGEPFPRRGHLERAAHCWRLCPPSREKPPFLGGRDRPPGSIWSWALATEQARPVPMMSGCWEGRRAWQGWLRPRVWRAGALKFPCGGHVLQATDLRVQWEFWVA